LSRSGVVVTESRPRLVDVGRGIPAKAFDHDLAQQGLLLCQGRLAALSRMYPIFAVKTPFETLS
jgi:hypothetical protein